MSRTVLIDGENLIYGLRGLLGDEKTLAPRNILDSFNYKDLINELLADNQPNKIMWFGAKLRIYDISDEIKAKTTEAVKAQSYFVNKLKAQDIDFVKVGYLRVRETEPCIKCKHRTYKLTEKGVDVGLAVKAIEESISGNEIVIISADTDLLPAIHTIRKIEGKVMYIGYEHRPIFSLSKAANSTRIISIPLARKYLKGVN